MEVQQNIKQFEKLMVANRGEIAIRILRAASELKIRTVAVYTFEDRYSLHRYKSDEAYQIGQDEDPLKPYLDIEELIAVAKRNGVDAIHPGYGFLSENVQFARRCGEEGITFIGPRPEVMERLGDKVAAKTIAREANVPVIEDSKQALTSLEVALEEAERISYPIMVKAASGGGGRGMRVVRNKEQLTTAYTEAKSEAGKAFGDDTIFLEKFIENPKHIEVQVLGDNHGHIVHLFERDCSVQRRFQKVVEVAPSVSLGNDVRAMLHDYALKIAEYVGYNNAGTVEFLVDRQGGIYFIEVNPRIQVEHTITEEVTGIDLVRTQIQIAKGHRLRDPQIYIQDQDDIQLKGYAIQCRITTEDPKENFKPDYGTIVAYRAASGYGIRLDEGSSYPGVKVSPFFDSMLVKISAKGRTLKGAARRMYRALIETRIRGVKTNIGFVQNVVQHPVFQAGQATVSFIEEHKEELLKIDIPFDRGTKTLHYIADVAINGHPDVKFKDDSKEFRQFAIPAFDKYGEYPKGTKDRLTELGREGFVKWLKEEPLVQFTDTTFRDAHQSLLATRVRTIDMMRVAEGFAKNHPNTFSMEVWGGATFDVAMRFLKESPWVRLQKLRKAMPNILLQMLLRGSNAVGYKAYPDNLIEEFVVKAAENGIDIFRIFDSLNWVEAMKVSIRTVRERTQSLAEATICYTGDLQRQSGKYNLGYYTEMAKQLEGEGAHLLAIKDMAGLLKPYAAVELVEALKKAVDLPIHLHTHDTSSIQSATYLKAIEAGVDVVDVALASVSGLTSQPNFNSLVASLNGQEREQPFDLPSLNAYSNYWEDVREYYYPFESGLKAGTAQVYDHEIPGGQYSNLRPQARALGLEERFETVKENYALVNHLFGDIVKVTPSSKVVGDMALFMTSNNLTIEDIRERGHTLAFPDSVVSLFRGELGQPHGGLPQDISKMVLKGENPFTDKPNAHLEPVDLTAEFEAFKQEFPHIKEANAYLDFLAYQLYPKVYRDFHAHREEFGEISYLPTPTFFYGMNNGEEILVEIGPGKTIIIKLLYISTPDDAGMRMVSFDLNGQNRRIQVRDRNVNVVTKQNRKAQADNEIGAPLQGRLVEVKVKPGDAVEENAPLFVIEAMKMESTITAPAAGTVKAIVLQPGEMVEQADLVVELEA